MPQAIQSLTSILPVLQTGGQLASAGSNLYQGYKNQQYQDQLRSLAGDPAKFNAYASKFVQPLNAGLQKGVQNQAQAYAAERGLAETPALSQEIVSQAIAPYIQQNQNQGYQTALQALGLGGGASPTDTKGGLTELFSGMKGLEGLGQNFNLAQLKSQSSGEQIPTINSPSLTSMIPYAESPGMQDYYTANVGGF